MTAGLRGEALPSRGLKRTLRTVDCDRARSFEGGDEGPARAEREDVYPGGCVSEAPRGVRGVATESRCVACVGCQGDAGEMQRR